MSLLSIKHVFGIETSLSNCIFYLDEHCYLYPSSRHIIIYNIDYKYQRLIPLGTEFDKLELLSVSPNKQYLILALNTLDKCRLILYDISGIITTPIRRRKILSLKQTISSTHVFSLVFSINSKFLLALYGAPDYVLVCWSIDRLKSLGTISLHIDLSYQPLNLQVSFNPNDSSQILITGNQIFRRYRLNNGRFSPNDHGQFQRYQSMNITCHCWLNDNQILLGLDTGFLCTINKHGDIIQRYNVTIAGESNHLLSHSLNALSSDRSYFRSISDVNLKKKKPISKIRSNSQLSSTSMINKTPLSTIDMEHHHQRQRRSSSHDHASKRELIPLHDIICLLPFSRGVFVSTRAGHVLMYERNENSAELTYLRTLMLPSSTNKNFSDQKIENNLIDTQSISLKLSKQQSNENILSTRSSFIHEKSRFHEVIQSLALSPNEETLLVGTNANHLYEFAFSKIDYTKKEANTFTHALDSAHMGAIRTGAICIRKPILLTLGIDRCLKIWNFQTNNQELNHQFVDEPLSISVHPTGIFVCISFWNSIRIYGYTIDGLTLFKELAISNVRVIEYSNQGHILAIAYDNILQFHRHNDYDQATYGRSNSRKFRLIRWTRDDAFLISVDFDDLVIRWNPYTGQRLSEYRIEDFNVQDLLISSDNKLAYLLGSDGKIREFLLMTTIREMNVPFDDCIPTALSIHDETRNIFIGSEKGSIYSIKLTPANPMIDTNTSYHLSQINVHQGAITKILIPFSNDIIVSLGEDGKLIIYNLNNFQSNKESQIIFRDEILVREVFLKEQSIELNYTIKRESEIARHYETKIETKEEEYIEHIHQLDLHCQGHIHLMQNKLTDLQQQKSQLKSEHEKQFNELIREKEDSIHQYTEEKSKNYQQIILRDRLFKNEIKNFKKNENEERDLTNDIYQRNIELIHLSYRKKVNQIKKKFDQEGLDVNERIDYLEDMKDAFEEDTQIELIDIHQNYQTKLRKIFDQIEELENEEVLFQTRLKQLEDESNRYENHIKEIEIKRKELIDQIQQVDSHLNFAKQTIEQRHLILQEKFKRSNEMENRRDELEKFAYVFNYKIRELTNEIAPRQYEIKALIEQFNHMDQEYHFLSQNNEKYSIQIDDYKARLRAREKELYNETLIIRKFNEIIANIKEDLKLCCHLIDQPKELIEIIRKIYGKYILQRNINFGQRNFFDYDRQRSYFERTNQTLQKKISLHIKRENIQQIQTIQEQINIMREISSYSLKVLELERILSDLDILSNIALNSNTATSSDLIQALRIQQNSPFIQEKQSELNSILNKQQKRIQQLRDFIQILERHLQQTSEQCGIKLTFHLQSNYSIDQSTIISPNSIYSQTSTNI